MQYLFPVIQRRRDKALKQRMGDVGLGLEFRMELTADKPRMVFDLDDLHQIPLGIKPRDHQPFLRQLLTIRIVKFITMAMALGNLFALIRFKTFGPLFQNTSCTRPSAWKPPSS